MFKRGDRKPRRMANLRAQMLLGEDWVPITVVNASPTGLMVKCPDPPAVGARVVIRHRGFSVTGEVIWSVRRRFGLRSDEDVDLDTLLAESGLMNRAATNNAPTRVPRWWHWRSKGRYGS